MICGVTMVSKTRAAKGLGFRGKGFRVAGFSVSGLGFRASQLDKELVGKAVPLQKDVATGGQMIGTV